MPAAVAARGCPEQGQRVQVVSSSASDSVPASRGNKQVPFGCRRPTGGLQGADGHDCPGVKQSGKEGLPRGGPTPEYCSQSRRGASVWGDPGWPSSPAAWLPHPLSRSLEGQPSSWGLSSSLGTCGPALCRRLPSAGQDTVKSCSGHTDGGLAFFKEGSPASSVNV